LNIQCLGEVDVNVDSLQRILQRKDSQMLRLLIEALENPEVLKIIRLSLSDFFSFKFFKKLRVPDHFAKHKRKSLMHHSSSIGASNRQESAYSLDSSY
jgi:hypothetical protein